MDRDAVGDKPANVDECGAPRSVIEIHRVLAKSHKDDDSNTGTTDHTCEGRTKG